MTQIGSATSFGQPSPSRSQGACAASGVLNVGQPTRPASRSHRVREVSRLGDLRDPAAWRVGRPCARPTSPLRSWAFLAVQDIDVGHADIGSSMLPSCGMPRSAGRPLRPRLEQREVELRPIDVGHPADDRRAPRSSRGYIRTVRARRAPRAQGPPALAAATIYLLAVQHHSRQRGIAPGSCPRWWCGSWAVAEPLAAHAFPWCLASERHCGGHAGFSVGSGCETQPRPRTEDMMALRGLMEKGRRRQSATRDDRHCGDPSDGAGGGRRSALGRDEPERLVQCNGYQDRDWETRAGRWTCARKA